MTDRKFTPEAEEEILNRLAMGETLNAICRDAHMPSAPYVSRMARELYDEEDPDCFGSRYARAREIGAYAIGDRVLDIPRELSERIETFVAGEFAAIREAAMDGTEVAVDALAMEKRFAAVLKDMVNAARLETDSAKWFAAKVLPRVFGDKGETATVVPVIIKREDADL